MSKPISPRELERTFPNASAGVRREVEQRWAAYQAAAAGAGGDGARLRAEQPQPDERMSLDGAASGEEACWHDAAERFEVVFTVYSRRPCDWDGYDVKALQDFLIASGIIPNDDWRTLSGRVVSRKAATAAEEKTVIEVLATPRPSKADP